MTAEPKKPRIGRPLKPAKGNKRRQLGVIVSAEIKRIIDKRAQDSDRTVSQETELMLEKALQFERTMQAMNSTLEMMQKQGFEAALFNGGFTPYRQIIDGKVWKAWLEPGHPRAQPSGFVP